MVRHSTGLGRALPMVSPNQRALLRSAAFYRTSCPVRGSVRPGCSRRGWAGAAPGRGPRGRPGRAVRAPERRSALVMEDVAEFGLDAALSCGGTGSSAALLIREDMRDCRAAW